MATANQTARDKFLEARKAGVDAVTARKQAYGEIIPAQAGGVAQASAPVAPPGTRAEAIGKVVNQVGGDVKSRQEARQLAESGLSAEEINNVRSRPNWGKKQEAPSLTQQQYATNPLSPPTQTQTGVNGETFQVAPTNPNTGLSQPTSPLATPINPVTANVTPPEATVASVVTPTPTPEVAPIPLDPNAEIKAKNEAQMALNKQKSDLAIQERKQQEADAKLASTPTDQKGVLNALVSGVNVPTQNTAAYRNAQAQYKNYQKFSTMTPSQLVSNMKMGEIDTATSQLLANNPSYIQAKQEFEKFQKNQSINKMVQSVANGATGKVQEVDHRQEASDSLAKKLGINETNADAYARIVSKNPDVVERVKNVSSLTRQLNTLVQERNTIYKDLKSQYPDLSPSAIMTLMAQRTQKWSTDIDSLNSSLAMEQADLKTAMELAKGEYEATSADITLQSDIAKEQRQMDNALALNQAEFDQKIAQQAQAMNDPTTAITTMVDEYKKLGIIPPKTAQTLLEEYSKSGKPLGKFLSTLQSDIQNTEEYKAYKAKQSGTEWQSTNITRYNPSTGANESTPIFYRKKTDGSFEAVDLAGNKIDASSIGGGTTTNIPPKPTGNIVPVTVGNKTVRLDQSGASGFENAVNQLITAGTPLTVGQGARDQVATIKSMASQFKIPFNSNNPAETAQKLRSAGHQVADPGKSNHETGMAIDVYSDNSMKSGPTTAQEKVLNSQGWYSAGIPGDAGHFEYRGVGGSPALIQTYDPNKIKSFEAFNGTTFPSDYKTPAQQKQFREEYDAWRASRPGLKIEKGNDITEIKLDTPTDGKLAVQTYASRMLDSVNNLMPLEKNYANLSLAEQLKQQYVPGILKSDDQKLIDANKKNFITAVLRKQSGASIAPSEFVGEEIKYFPQPGDSKTVIIAKQNARNAEIKAMLTEAGYDTEGNSLSKYYNPPILTTEDTATPVKTDKITELKKNYFTQK